jgi:hypothetical protein
MASQCPQQGEHGINMHKKGVFLQDKQIFCLAQRGKENAGARYAATESAWSLLAK